MRRFQLRIPKTPHAATDRLVSVAHCGCETCEAARAEEEAAHWGRVGNLLGMSDDDDTSRGPKEVEKL